MNNLSYILIVEDDETILSLVSMILEEDSYLVRRALNGKEALSIIETEGIPNLILLDMSMPIMDGWQFAAELRRLYGKEVPIVVMTAATDGMKRAEDIGANECILKPFNIEMLQEAVKHYIF